jgi:hypothetical protein
MLWISGRLISLSFKSGLSLLVSVEKLFKQFVGHKEIRGLQALNGLRKVNQITLRSLGEYRERPHHPQSTPAGLVPSVPLIDEKPIGT